MNIFSKEYIQSTIRKFSEINSYPQFLFNPFPKTPSTLKVNINRRGSLPATKQSNDEKTY